MNFQTVLEELDRLYEEDTKKVNNETEETTQEVVEEGIVGTVAGAAIGKAIGNALTEDEEDATEVEEGLLGGAVAGFAGAALKNKLTEDDEEIDDEIEDEIEDDEEAAPEEEQLVLECNKCGGIVIKPFKDVKIDDESDLANVDEACQYCEETEGYKIMGVLAPYGEIVEEAMETNLEAKELEEGIFNKNKEPETIRGFSPKDPTFAAKVAKELKDKFGGEIKQVKIKTGLADIWVDTAKKAKAANKYITKQYPDAAFSYNEYDSITEDVNTEVLSEDDIA